MAELMTLLYADDVALPQPNTYEPIDYDTDSDESGTSETGILNRDIVRMGQWKINLKWTLDSAKLTALRTAIFKEKFECKFLTESGYITKTMYAGNRNRRLLKNTAADGSPLWELSCNFIEY